MLSSQLHLVIFGVGVPSDYLIVAIVGVFGRGEREAALALEKCPPRSSDLDLLVEPMLGNEFAHDAPHRPDLNGRVVFGLHQYDLGGSVPSTHHMEGHLLQSPSLVVLQIGEGEFGEA